MLLHKAMKYYRLWIYTCNVVLLLGVVVFVVTATVLLSDIRFQFVPVTMYHPTFLYSYLALMAQGGLLQAVGCYGALRLNERWLNVYWFAMLFLLVGDLVVGIVWMFLFDGLAHGLPAVLRTRIRQDYGSEPHYTHNWNRLQEEFACCGVHGPGDFNGTPWALLLPFTDTNSNVNNESLFVPNSCCLTVDYYVIATDDYQVELPPPQPPPPPRNLSRSEGPYMVSCDIQSSGAPASSSPPSHQQQHDMFDHQQDARVHGCALVILDWLQHCADVLFVLGYCVIAFLKLCFLGILRYEIKEMIQKIKVLQSDVPDFCELMSDSVTATAAAVAAVTGATTTTTVAATDTKVAAANSTLATDRLLLTVAMDRKARSNGNNNNDLELMELARNGT